MTTFTFATSGVHTPILLSAHAAYSASRSLVNAGVDQVVPFIVQRPDTPTQHDITALFPSYAAADAFAEALRSEGLCAVSIADALRTNLVPDPHLRTVAFTPSNGAATVTHPTALGPSGNGYMRVLWTAANTTSPQTITLTGSGLDELIPATPGDRFRHSSSMRRGGGDLSEAQVLSVNWHSSSGAFLSSSFGASRYVGLGWERWSDEFIAPADTAFVRPLLVMSGLFEVNDFVDFGDVLFEHDAALLPFFSGDYSPSAAFDGAWTGPADASASVLVPKGVQVEQFDGISSSQVRVQNTPGIGATEVQFTLTEVPA